MARLEEIDKSTLKVGDTVGVMCTTIINWCYFKYSRIIPKTIARITPARTKFVMTDGTDYKNTKSFYKFDEEVRRQNYVIDCAKEIQKCINKLQGKTANGAIFRKSDDDIIKISGILKELCKEIEEE